MLTLASAGKIISAFFKEIGLLGDNEVERDEISVFVNVEDAELFGKTAYSYCVNYFDSDTVYVNILFDSRLVNPDIAAYEAVNAYNRESVFWKVTIENGDLVFRCHAYAVESETALAETLMASFNDLQQNDNGELLETLLSYVNY